MMVEPVVVNPEEDSKNASINEWIVLLKRYGNVPKAEKIIQERVTEINPSLLETFLKEISFDRKKQIKAAIDVIRADQIKGSDGSL